jgi:leucine dehydrogenase
MSKDQTKSIFNYLNEHEHEQLIYCHDKELGLKAIVGIHNTALGPAIGGTRMWNYTSDEEALNDVINLSMAMSYKSSLAGLNAGGGKAVIIGDPKIKNEKFIRRYAEFLNDLKGKYWTAQDVNMTSEDIVNIKKTSRYVVGLPKEHGGLGDSSVPTAYGVYLGMKSALMNVTGKDSLSDKKILIQGVGKVGGKLIDYLLEEGSKIYAYDINKNNLEKFNRSNIIILKEEDIFKNRYDIYSPCALGGAVNKDSVDQIECDIIAGAANNQISDEDIVLPKLKEKNILYIPDFLINAGGIISVYHEQINDLDTKKVMDMTSDIFDKVTDVLKFSSENNISSFQAAVQLAKDRINKVSEK